MKTSPLVSRFSKLILLTVLGVGIGVPIAIKKAPSHLAASNLPPSTSVSTAATHSLGMAEPLTAPPLSISGNPAASNILAGTGSLGRWLGLKEDSGVWLGGLLTSDGNVILSGGAEPGKVTGNNLFILGLNLDTQKLSLWNGGMFHIEFLQFNGMNTNDTAGTIQGFDSLTGPPPLNRSELYQLWYRQTFADNKLILRFGKTVPTYDFDNVLRPVPIVDANLSMPKVTGLLFTPVFVNPTMLGVMPGYYNSAYGATSTYAPFKNLYFSAAAFDGNLANGTQTGINGGPSFDGYYFYIGESGFAWQQGKDAKPGLFAVGGWGQTGQLTIPDVAQEQGAQGIYSFGSQRLWFRNPGIDSSGISGFFQLGANDSRTLPIDKYVGAGLTAYALTRPLDSFGLGMAWSWLNQDQFDRTSELMFQTYYQAHLFYNTYLASALTYIPTPGASKDIPQTWAATLQLSTLF